MPERKSARTYASSGTNVDGYGGVGFATERDKASYIADLAQELAALAAGGALSSVHGLLVQAAAEARQFAKAKGEIRS